VYLSTVSVMCQVTGRLDWRAAVKECHYDPQCSSLILTGTQIDVLRNSDTPMSEIDEYVDVFYGAS